MHFYPEMPAPFPFFQDMNDLHYYWGKSINIITAATLSATLTATQNSFTVTDPRDGKICGLNNNIILIADSSAGKTLIANEMLEPIIKYQESKNAEIELLQQQAKKNAVIWNTKRKALERKLSKAIDDDDQDFEELCRMNLEQHLSMQPIVPLKRYYIQNGLTYSSIKRGLHNADIHPTFYIQEGVALVDTQGHRVVSLQNPIWNNEEIHLTGRYDKDNADIKNPHSSTFVAIQNKLFVKHFSKNEMLNESGANNRTLIFEATEPTSTGFKSEQGDLTLERIKSRHIELLSNETPRTLQLSIYAKSIFLRMVYDINILKNTNDTKEAAVPGFMGKYDLHLLRVAAWLHLLYREGDTIDADCLCAANSIMQNVLDNHLWYFSDYYRPSALQQNAESVYQWIISRSGYENITVRSVNKNGPPCARDRDELEQQLQFLVSKGFIKLKPEGKKIFILFPEQNCLLYCKS